MTPAEYHAARALLTARGAHLWDAIVALTQRGEPRTLDALAAESGLSPRTVKRAKVDLVAVGLLPGGAP